MESKIEEVYDMVQQMQTTHQTTLRRLDRMQTESNTCQCLSQLDAALEEVQDLRLRVQYLEKKDEEREKQVDELKTKIDNLALSIQTDDSKLRRSMLAKNTPNVSENRQDIKETLPTGNDEMVVACATEPSFERNSRIKERGAESVAEPKETSKEGLQTGIKSNKVEESAAAGGKKPDNKYPAAKQEAPNVKVTNKQKKVGSKPNPNQGISQSRTQGVIKARGSASPAPGTILKPNFGADSSKSTEPQTGPEVELVEQFERRSHFSTGEWEMAAGEEREAAKNTDIRHLGGIHDIIVLDISASMVSAWSQARTFFMDFIGGLEEMAIQIGLIQEYVALVTFGLETKVQLRLTNNFNLLRQKFSGLKVGGPTPIFAGLSTGWFAATSADSVAANVNSYHQGTRFILITDGEATDSFSYQGPDIPDLRRLEETREHIFQQTTRIQQIEGELICVPVGNANKDFFELMESVASAKIVDYRKGRQLSRKVFLMLNMGGLNLPYGSSLTLTEEDKKYQKEIEEDEKKFQERRHDIHSEIYTETSNKDLPEVGSRVRRGPDWEYEDQDSGGPGTVIGHSENDGRVHVCWDADNSINIYHYGKGRRYDILLVDEPRVLKLGETIAVGCVVKPGPFWKPEEGLTTESEGVVIRLDLGPSGKPQASVRWKNGKRGHYACDVLDDPEILVSTDTETKEQTAGKQSDASPPTKALPKPRKFKNKNKNQN